MVGSQATFILTKTKVDTNYKGPSTERHPVANSCRLLNARKNHCSVRVKFSSPFQTAVLSLLSTLQPAAAVSAVRCVVV